MMCIRAKRIVLLFTSKEAGVLCFPRFSLPRKLHRLLLTILLLGMKKTNLHLCPMGIFPTFFACTCTLAEKMMMNQCC